MISLKIRDADVKGGASKINLRGQWFYTGIISLVSIAVVYGIINLALYGGQSLWHIGDKKKLEQIKAQLDQQLILINTVESNLKSEENNLISLKNEIDGAKNTLDRLRLTDIYKNNYDLYNKHYDEYKSQLESYNSSVEEANELAKKVGTTWYVIPIPRGK